jgi:hypothetical protein
MDKGRYIGINEDPSPIQNWDNETLQLFNNYQEKPNLLSTLITPAFISWRYANNPLFRYNYFTDNKNFLLITRIKYHAFAKELRLVEFVLLNPAVRDKEISDIMKKEVYQFCKKHDIDLLSFSGQQYHIYKSYFQWMGIMPVRPLGPMITLRELNMKNQFNGLLDISNWGYSIGDMELF